LKFVKMTGDMWHRLQPVRVSAIGLRDVEFKNTQAEACATFDRIRGMKYLVFLAILPCAHAQDAAGQLRALIAATPRLPLQQVQLPAAIPEGWTLGIVSS